MGFVTQWVLRNGDTFKVADSVPSGWEQPSFNDSAWRTQVSPFAYTSLSPLGQPQYYYPGVLNERALGPGPDDVVQIGSQYGGSGAPSQLWFRRSVTVPKTGTYRFVGFSDNDLALYWDGSLIMQNHYFGTANFDREINLVAGTHLLAGQITGDTNYDGVGFAIFWDEPIVQDIVDGPASRIVRYY